MAEGAPPEAAVHASGGRTIHARRVDRGGTRGVGAAARRGHRHDVHEARREPRAAGRGGCRRRPLPGCPGRDPRGGHRRRDLGQADPVGARSRRGRHAHASGAAGRARDGDGLLPVDRHGRERLHRGDDPALRAIAGRPATDRDLPPGVPPSHRGRHRALDAARSGHPPRQGRVRRAGVDGLPRQAAGRRELPRPRGPAPARGPRARGSPGARHP